MSEKTDRLHQDIQAMKQKTRQPAGLGRGANDYNVALTIMTDLLGNIFIGCAIGLCLQWLFQTSVLLTAGLTLLGGVSGLYTTVRYGLRQERKRQP